MALIAHYRLDNDAKDWIGGRDGRITGEVQWVKGVLGGALDLTGGSKWVTGDGWPITGDFSYSFWAKRISATSIGGLVGNHWHTSGPTGVNVYFRSSSTQITVATANGATRPSYTVNLITPNTEWCHYAVTCRDGWVSIYQNGQHLDTRYRDIVQDQSRAWAIGRWTASYGSYYYDGLIDDVRIYDHALSPREVRDLRLGLVGHYPLRWDAVNSAGYNSGNLNGSVVFSEEMGGSAEFDNSSYIQLDTGITGDPDELSASFWAKTDSLQTYDGLLQFDGVGSYEDGFVITSASSTSMRLRYWSDGGTNTTWSVGDFATGKESHFCVTLKDNLFTIYQDGEKVGEHTYTNPLDLSGGVKLGLYSWSSNYFTGWIKDTRIYATALTTSQVKELYQQRASLDSEGSVHTPLVLQSPRARYIRDWINGSTSNNGNHWLEVRAVYAGENISLGKPVTAISGGTNLSKVTDGTTSNSGYAQTSRGILSWVQVDLEEVREIDEVKVWHYNADGRTYYDTKTEISEDGINWTTIFDSAVSGTYKETSAGITHAARALEPFSVSEQGIKAPDVSELGVTRGLVAYYPLIGDTKDYAGTNHAVNNGAVATAEGYEFDGTTNYLLIEPTTVDASVDFTLSFWIYPRGTSTYTLYCARTSLGDGLSIFGLNGKIRFDLGSQWTTTVAPPLDEWSHVTVSREGDSKFIFFNGVLVASTSIGTLTNFNPNLSTVGASQVNGSTYANYMDGIIRDFRSFNRSLTEEEVGILYNLTTPFGSRMVMTDDCLYVKGQIKEVIS